jgi:3'-5' exoribonuclease
MSSKQVYINQLKEGQNLEEIFVLLEARLAQSRNGPFWDLKLQDRTGQIDAKIWHPQSTEYVDLAPGLVVQAAGQVRSFRDRPQLNVTRLRALPAEEEQAVWPELIPSSEVPPERLLEELETICRCELSLPAWKKLCRKILKDEEIRSRLLAAPAAKSVHHAYRGGLLEHTLKVVRVCLSLSELYEGLDRDILIVAAVVHDLGKAWELEGGIVRDYTDQGQLLGHIVIGLEILEPFLSGLKELPRDLILHLKHMVVSHHGEYLFGSPKRPMTREALLLHYADNLDAKMNTADKALEDLEGASGQWTSVVYALERRLYRPGTSSGQAAASESEAQGQEKVQQCLLPLKE